MVWRLKQGKVVFKIGEVECCIAEGLIERIKRWPERDLERVKNKVVSIPKLSGGYYETSFGRLLLAIRNHSENRLL